MNTIKRVKKNELANSLAQARKIIEDLHKYFNEKKEYKFTERLVGSAKWNIVLRNKDDFFDLDFQILLTKKSRKLKHFDITKEHKNEATMVKDDFFNFFNDKYKDSNVINVENSTTSITFINRKEKYSIDFVIIRYYPENNQIIRRNNSKENPTINNYVWNKLTNNNNIYEKFKNLSSKEKEDLIENYILPKKAKEKQKDKNDPSLKASYIIFIEEVNNYVAREQNN